MMIIRIILTPVYKCACVRAEKCVAEVPYLSSYSIGMGGMMGGMGGMGGLSIVFSLVNYFFTIKFEKTRRQSRLVCGLANTVLECRSAS